MSHAAILQTLDATLADTPAAQAETLRNVLDGGGRVFLAGAGRSALVARFFAMRLMHCGFEAFVVGEIVTPAIGAGDVLVIVSGSGATATLLPIALTARTAAARVVLLSTRATSPLAAMADHLCLITPREGDTQGARRLPLGTAFELATLVYLEALVYAIVCERGLDDDVLRARHANLE